MSSFAATVFLCSVAFPFLLGFVIVFLPFRQRWRLAWPSLTLALLGGLIALAWSIYFWLTPFPTSIQIVGVNLGGGLPSPTISLACDRLSALFMILASGFSVVVSLYSYAYLGLFHTRAYRNADEQTAARSAMAQKEQAPVAGSHIPINVKPEADAHGIAAAYNLFVLFMLIVLVAANVFLLLVALEGMSLAFGYLVLYQHNRGRDQLGRAWTNEDRRNRKLAIQSYLISSHISTVLLTVALLLRATQVGSFRFDAFQRTPSSAGTVPYLFALVALAIRSGIVPFHIWIPLAHPSSPTNTHALSLGVAIKVAVFLLIRVCFQWFGPTPEWFGPILLLLASVTALVGIYYTMVCRDLKTALSYSSLGHVGIIIVGVGLGVMLVNGPLHQSPEASSLAALAMVAALCLTINHAVFKGLLYLCTGAIQKLTGTVEYDSLGGLMRGDPWTTAAFVIGTLAIAGFPPLNGFVGEWLIVQGIIGALHPLATAHQSFALVVVVASLVLLAITFGLTAFTFVKIAGRAILGAPRRIWREFHKHEPWLVRLIFAFLATLCLALGVVPGVLVFWTSQVASDIGLPSGSMLSGGSSIDVAVYSTGVHPAYSASLEAPALWVLAGGLAVLVIGMAYKRLALAQQSGPRLKMAPIWSAAIPYDPVTMQATNSYFGYALYRPLLLDTGAEQLDGEWLSRMHTHTHAASNVLPDTLPISYRYHVPDLFRWWYNRVLAVVLASAKRFTLWLQNGRMAWYVSYPLITLLVLVGIWFWTFWWRR